MKEIKTIRNTNDYIPFAVFTLFSLVLFTAAVLWFIADSKEKQNSDVLYSTTLRVTRVVSDLFDSTNRILSSIGKELIKEDTQDLDNVLETFKSAAIAYGNTKEYFSWSSYDWVNPEGLQLVNTAEGVRSMPVDMKALGREYVELSPRHPWTLQLAHPVIGIPSGKWVIPAGTGIADQRGNFLGTIVVGFSVALLTEKIEKIMEGEEVSFVVLDDQHRIVLKSTDNEIDPASSYFREHIPHTDAFKQPYGTIASPITYSDVTYTHYQRFSHYPYLILTGFKTPFLTQQRNAYLYPVLSLALIIGLLFLTVLFFFKKYLNSRMELTVNSVRESRVAKEIFLQKLRKTIRAPLDAITYQVESILQQQHGDLPLDYVVTLKNILFCAEDIRSNTPTVLDKKDVSLRPLIEDCVSYHQDIIHERSLQFHSSIAEDIATIELDEIRFRQIIVGLIHQSVLHTPKGGKVEMQIELKPGSHDSELLAITIRDNGYPLDAPHRLEILEQHQQVSREGFLNDEISWPTIKHFIKLHDGTLTVRRNRNDDGNVIEVIIPRFDRIGNFTPPTEPPAPTKDESEKNVVQLFKK